MRILKVLSALLSYPEGWLAAASPEIAAEIAACTALPPGLRDGLAVLAQELASGDPIGLEERYVALFDQSRSLSLHLFEHLHGESRDRGQAMVDLRNYYERHDMAIVANELPDYLPLLLEFASTLNEREATGLLAEVRGIVASLAERLAKRRSPYAAALEAVVALAGSEAGRVALATPEAEARAGPGLDRAWEEDPVRFREEAPAAGPSPPAIVDVGMLK